MKLLRIHLLVQMMIASAASFAFADGSPIEREQLLAKTFDTWEGRFRFADEQIVRIEGLPDIHAFVYRCDSQEGSLLVLGAMPGPDLVDVLLDADANRKGVFPVFENIDVIPAGGAATLLIRWRHPGQGALRMIQQLKYQPGSLVKEAEGEMLTTGAGAVWVNPAELPPSRPAVRAVPHG